jgi:hypothetical protein
MRRRALPSLTCNAATKHLPKDAMKTLHSNLIQMDKDLEEKLSSFHDTISEYAYAGGTTGHQDYNHANADVISV